MTIKERVVQFRKKEEVLVLYLRDKTTEADWHAVSDAANDIREVRAKIEVFEEMLGYEATLSMEATRLVDPSPYQVLSTQGAVYGDD